MNKIRLYLLPVGLGFVVLLGVLWLARFKILVLRYREDFKNLPAQQKILKLEPVIHEDQAALGKYDLFRPSKGSADAGVFLNDKIHWEVGEIHHQGSLVLPEFIKKEMNKDWAVKKPLFKKMGLDFKWMKELLKYDHWNPEEHSPAFPVGKKYLTYSFPVPSYRDLMAWAKLRLLYGKEQKDIPNAFKEVRHLIRLIWTNDYLVSSMVAVNMLKIEHQFHETLLPEEEGSWELIPEEIIMRGKRYFYSSRSLAEIYLDDEVFDRLTNTNVGICPMVVESLMSYISMRELMKNELKDRFDRMNHLVTKTQKICRKTIVHKMWEDPTWPTFMKDDKNPMAFIGDQTILWKKITWNDLKESDDLKALLGYVLLTSSIPSVFSGYEDSK